MPTSSTPRARWGLLITNLVMGLALVFSGVLTWVDARNSSDSVEKARGTDLMFAARRALVAAGKVDQEAVTQEFQGLQSQGVTFIGIFDADGQARATAGKPVVSLGKHPFNRADQGLVITRLGQPERMRMVDHLLPGVGVAGLGGGRRPCRGMGCRMKRAFMGNRLLLEYEPSLSDGLISRAFWVLVISVNAAALLLGAALIFWRLSRRSERIADQLERDRRLAALGEMSAVLGHELRNPLTALKGHAQLLVERLGPEHPDLSGAQTVVREAVRLERLTGQVLDFARRGELDPQETSLAGLLQEALSGLDPERVVLDQSPGLDSWILDRDRIRQVLVNLLDNALQAAPDEQVTLGARLDGDMLALAVGDKGTGLSKEEREHIFEPFTTSRTRGTGLGLAVARRIVEAHRGSIQVGSGPDGGAVFTVTLPPGELAENGS